MKKTKLYIGLSTFKVTQINKLSKVVKADWLKLKTKDGVRRRNVIVNVYKGLNTGASKPDGTPIYDGVYGMLWLFISDKILMSKSGKKRFVNEEGYISKWVSDANEAGDNFQSGVCRPIYQGEDRYLAFIKALTTNMDIQNFMTYLEQAKIDFRSVLEEPMDLVSWFEKNKKDCNKIGLLAYVDTYTKDNVVRYSQRVSSDYIITLDTANKISEESVSFVERDLENYKEYFKKDKIEGEYALRWQEFDETRIQKPRDVVQDSLDAIEEIDDDDLPF